MFTKPQVVLTGFYKQSVTSGPWECKQNQRRETAWDLNAF